MGGRAPAGISRSALAFGLAVVMVIAAVATYAVVSPGPSTTSAPTSTSSTSAASVGLTIVPPSPLISPGETQNYTEIQIQEVGQGPTGVITLKAFAPAGLSLILNQTSALLSGVPLTIPVVLKAEPSLSTGNYSVTVEASSTFLSAENTTFTIGVVAELVVMLDVAFHPQNITVAKGTTVTWMNLDTQIGCCDPGNHDVSLLLPAGNTTSPVLTRYESWSYTFGAEGAVDYYCTIHPWMKGQVAVTG